MARLKRVSFCRVVKYELSRIAKSRVMFFTLLVAPLASLITLTWLFSAGVVTDLPISVVDQDNSSTSRTITRMLDASAIAEVESMSLSLLDAKNEMDRGKIEAIVVLPKNLEKEIFKASSPQIAVYINNTNLIKGGSLKSGLYKTLATASVGIKVQSYVKKGLSERKAFNQAMPVRLDTHKLFNSFGNYAYFLTIGLLPLILNVFVFLVSTYALGTELKEGTSHNLLRIADNKPYIAILGKLLPYTVVFIFYGMVMNVFFFSIIGIPINGSIGLIVLSEILQVIAYQFLAVLFLGLTANLRLSLSLGSAYTMMSLSFSGLTFPRIGMPLMARLFSYIFPNTFWIEIFVSQTLRAQPAMSVLVPYVALVVFIIAGLLSFSFLAKRYSNPIYWGRI